MIIQNPDGSLNHTQQPDKSDYYAAVPASMLDDQSSLIERLINFAFDILGARHLEVRVYDSEPCSAESVCQSN